MQDKILIDTSKVKAIIFDLDGTIVNNMPYQMKAWVSFASKYNKHLNEEIFHKKYSGLRSDAILLDLFNKELELEEIESYRTERGSIYKEIFEKEIKEVEGLSSLLQNIKDKGLKLALATTASKSNRDFVLDRLNLRDFFDVIIGGEHVRNGKPNPEIYTLAVSKLGIPEDSCIAFEDSVVGIQSALSAGLKVIGVLTSHNEKELPRELIGAINDFTQIDIL